MTKMITGEDKKKIALAEIAKREKAGKIKENPWTVARQPWTANPANDNPYNDEEEF